MIRVHPRSRTHVDSPRKFTCLRPDFDDWRRTRSELLDLNPELMKHRQEYIAQRLILRGVESHVTRVVESAACQQNWKVGAAVNIRVAQVAPVQNHRLIKHAARSWRWRRSKPAQQVPKVPHLLEIDFMQFR